jgi:hypothetical protein
MPEKGADQFNVERRRAFMLKVIHITHLLLRKWLKKQA